MAEPVTLSSGDKAPDFKAVLTDGSTITLSDMLDSGRGVILYFYPRDNTPGCTVQACDFRDNIGRLENNKWTGRDLNPRPPPCQVGILPD